MKNLIAILVVVLVIVGSFLRLVEKPIYEGLTGIIIFVVALLFVAILTKLSLQKLKKKKEKI